MRKNVLSDEERTAILAIGAKLNSRKNLEDLLEEIQLKICSYLNAEAASIFVYNEVDNIMNFLSLTGEASQAIKTIQVPMSSIAGTVFLSEKAKIVNDIAAYSGHFKGTDKKSGFVTKNLMAIPLKTEKVYGVLEIVNKREDLFTEFDLEAADLITQLIGFKLSMEYERNRLAEQMKAMIESVSRAIDLRDNYTHRHSKNVASLSKKIGGIYGLNNQQLKEIEIAALLHDLGKIGITDSVLQKPGVLTQNEYEIIKQHPKIGKQILEGSTVISEAIVRGIAEHHEKLDGSGYPNGLKGDAIHLYAKIIAIADIFDAMSNKRVYKEPMGLEQVLVIMDSMVPETLDKNLVSILKKVVNDG